MRREYFFLALWFVFIGLVWMGPALWGYAMHITDHDTALYYYPILDFYAKALQSGQSFLWIPGMFSGFPIYVSQTGGFFDPINILIYSFLDGINGTHLRLFLDFIATFLFSYLAARSFGISRIASALVGPSFLLAFHLRFLSNPLIANTLFLIPLLLYAANGLLNSMSHLKVVLLISIGLGISLLSGYTQIVFYALIATVVYLTLRLTFFREDWNVRILLIKARVFTLAVVLGVIIGLPFIIPASVFLPLSARAEAPTYEQSTLKVVEYGDIVLFAVPDHFYIPYLTAGRKPLYVGALWFLLALAAIGYSYRLIRHRIQPLSKADAELVAISCTAILLLLLSVQYSPFYYVVSKLPILEQFRFPYRFMYVGAFFLALLGAIGLDRFPQFLKTQSVRMIVWIWIGFSSLLAAAILFVNMLSEGMRLWIADTLHLFASTVHVYGFLGMAKGEEHYRDAFKTGLDAAHELLPMGDIAIALPVAITIASLAAFSAYLRSYLSESHFRKYVIAVTLVTVLFLPMLRYRYYVPREQVGIEGHIALSVATEDDKELYRMYSFLVAEATRKAIPPQYQLSAEEAEVIKQIYVLGGFPNHHLYHNLGSVDGYDQFETRDTLAAMGSIGGELFAGYGAGTPEERRSRLIENLDILSMMGGKYIISGLTLDHPRLKLLSGDKYTDFDLTLYLYELTDTRPRYYFAEDVVSRPHQDFQGLMQNSTLSFKSETYLDCVQCVSSEGKSKFDVRAHKNGYYAFETSTANEQYLVLSESNIPGWNAFVDGKEAPIMRANGLYMAVAVPEGQHEVTFEYQGLLGELRILKAIGLVRE